MDTSTLALTSNWLAVRDQNGNVLSNQVAFIIMAPGVALATQNRAGATPTAQNFLDSYTVNGTTYKNWDSDLDFIAAPRTNNTVNQFNDRLLYVTRNELMSRLVDRVAGEVRLGLNTYYLTYHTYPAKLTDITSLPSWFNANNWTNTNPSTADILYTPPPPPQPTPPSQVTIGFRGCTGVTYTFTWHSVTSNSDMKRNGSC